MKIHYFQRYHKGEDVATANTMLLLSRLYSYSSDKFFSFLTKEMVKDHETWDEETMNEWQSYVLDLACKVWENCSLRRWLNEDFYNSKFSDGEKAAIVTTHNTYTEDDYHYESDCGNDTDDKVYVCSYIEALAVSDDTRNAVSTGG